MNGSAVNRHRSGIAWSKSAIRVILTNPRYTGHQVWNRQRRQESLIDVENVALGHQSKQFWNAKEAWIRSEYPAHTALISQDIFQQVQDRMASRCPASTGREVVRTRHPRVFKGMIIREFCQRRMQGNWSGGVTRYRCRFPEEYALANRIDRPLSVSLREDVLVGPVDAWLAGAFAPSSIEHSLAALEEAQPDTSPTAESARQALKECDRKLGRYRAALAAGADPALIAEWSGGPRRPVPPRRSA
ncbi:recombinase family protein [Streptomyces albiaxialis]